MLFSEFTKVRAFYWRWSREYLREYYVVYPKENRYALDTLQSYPPDLPVWAALYKKSSIARGEEEPPSIFPYELVFSGTESYRYKLLCAEARRFSTLPPSVMEFIIVTLFANTKALEEIWASTLHATV